MKNDFPHIHKCPSGIEVLGYTTKCNEYADIAADIPAGWRCLFLVSKSSNDMIGLFWKEFSPSVIRSIKFYKLKKSRFKKIKVKTPAELDIKLPKDDLPSELQITDFLKHINSICSSPKDILQYGDQVLKTYLNRAAHNTNQTKGRLSITDNKDS